MSVGSHCCKHPIPIMNVAMHLERTNRERRRTNFKLALCLLSPAPWRFAPDFGGICSMVFPVASMPTAGRDNHHTYMVFCGIRCQLPTQSWRAFRAADRKPADATPPGAEQIERGARTMDGDGKVDADKAMRIASSKRSMAVRFLHHHIETPRMRGLGKPPHVRGRQTSLSISSPHSSECRKSRWRPTGVRREWDGSRPRTSRFSTSRHRWSHRRAVRPTARCWCRSGKCR